MVTILCGDNSWAIAKKSKDIFDTFVSNYGDLSVQQFDGIEADFNSVTNAVISLPFLVEKKLVVLRRASENSELSEKIEMILQSADDSTDLMIVEAVLDKRKAYYKTLKKQQGFNELVSLNGPQLNTWVTNEAKNHDAQISFNDAKYLIDRIGQDQLLLSSEIDKLALFNKQITKETIDLLTEASPESSIFDLLAAAFSGSKSRALELYQQQRRQQVEPYQIVAMLGWQLHQIALAKAFDGSPNDLAREAGMNPYAASKSISLAGNMTFKEILQTASQLTDLEHRAKTTSVNIDEGVKTLLISL